MSINSNIVSSNIRTLEYNKYVEILNDTRFPQLTVVEQSYDAPFTTQTNVFNKNAVLTYDIGTNQANGLPFGDNSSIDAFGRLRVSDIEPLLDSKHLFDNLPYTYDQILSGTCTSQYLSGNSCVVLSTSANGSYAIRQTFESFNYQPGKSTLCFFSGLFSSETNITKRVGLFTSNTIDPFNTLEGFYFENASGTLTFNIANPYGFVASQSISQSNWNVDRLDGTGPSGYTLDMSKTQIVVLDFEWLGVGRVRMGFVINGQVIYCHTFNNANNKNAVYLRMPNLPVRYEIRQTGAGSGSLQHICATVNVENTGTSLGNLFSVNTGNAANTFTKQQNGALLSFKINPTWRGAVISLEDLQILTDSNINYRYEVVLNPTYSSPLTYAAMTNSPFLSAVGDGTITSSGGYQLYVGYANQKNSSTVNIPDTLFKMGFKINGTSDVLGVNIYPFGSNNAIVYGSLNLKSAN